MKINVFHFHHSQLIKSLGKFNKIRYSSPNNNFLVVELKKEKAK